MKNLLMILSIIFLFSCGQGGSSGGKKSSTGAQREERMGDGKYKAILRPLNSSINGFIPYGNAEIEVEGDRVSIQTYLDDDAAVTHMQNIHLGTECPTLKNDRNKDGFIDINEAQAILKAIIIPLDSDINSQVSGENNYPKGSSFTYTKTGSLAEIQNDLEKMNLSALSLVGKVVLIHGTSVSANIPDSVTSLPGMEKSHTIPIACGKIVRITE